MQLHPINFEDLRNEHALIKQQFPCSIVLLHIGNCYETFDNDAETIAYDLKRSYIWQETDNGTLVRSLTLPEPKRDWVWKLCVRGHRVITATVREVQS